MWLVLVDLVLLVVQVLERVVAGRPARIARDEPDE
jgi:hypothetical protein